MNHPGQSFVTTLDISKTGLFDPLLLSHAINTHSRAEHNSAALSSIAASYQKAIHPCINHTDGFAVVLRPTPY